MTQDTARLSAALGDRYLVEHELGAGAMANVYRARDLRHDRHVAVKVLRPELAAVLGSERFLHEIWTAAKLNHPHILPLHDSGEAEGFLYYVMPVVEGESLRDRLRRERQLPIDDAVAIVKQVASALDYAHRQGVIHRDVKPENILLHEGEAMVTDFGIALAVREAGGTRLTETGFSLGTPDYMSPEQAAGERELDARTDVYALGCVLFEMLAGEPPFTGATAQSVLAKRLSEPPPKVTTLRVVPSHVETVVTRALAQAPVDRYGSAGELAQGLATPGAEDAPERRSRRWAPIGAAALAATALIGFILARPDPGEPSENVIAIFPFACQCTDDTEILADGMTQMMSATVDGIAEWRAADVGSVLRTVDRGRAPDAEKGRALASQLGANLFVTGNLLELPDGLEGRAALLDVNGSRLAVTNASVGSVEEYRDLVDRLARGLVAAYLGSRAGARMDSVAAVTSGSLVALRHYLRAMRAVDAQRMEALQLAIDADSTFALAHYRMAVQAVWTNRLDLAERSLQAAQRWSSTLPQREQQLLAGLRAYIDGDATAAERRYRQLATRYEDADEAWFMLGETLMHLNLTRGRPPTEAIPAFERAVQLDTSNAGALNHLADLMLLADRHDAHEAITEIMQRREARRADTQWHALARSAYRGDGAASDSLLDLIAAHPEIGTTYNAVRVVGGEGERLDLAQRLTSHPDMQSRTGGERMAGHLWGALVAEGRGQRRFAGEELDAAARLDENTAMVLEAMLATRPFVEYDSTRLVDLHRFLSRWDVGSPARDTLPAFDFLGGFGPFLPELRLNLLGSISLALGRPRDALVYADTLDALADRDTSLLAVARDLSSSLRARVAWERGDHRTSEDLLSPTFHAYPYNRTWLHRRETEMALRAEQLVEAGELEEAAEIYGLIGWGAVLSFPDLAVARRRQGELYEQLGDTAKAVDYYSRFVNLWNEADPEFQPLVEDVRRRIARLVSEQATSLQ